MRRRIRLSKTRRFNLRWLRCLRWLGALLIAVIVGSGLVHLLHEYQMKRIATVFLREARRAQSEDRPEDAIRNLRNYVTLRPNDIEGLDLFGQQLVKMDDIGPAYFTLEKVLLFEPQRTDTRRELVTLAMKIGRFHEAVENIEELLKTSPQDGELWELKGKCQIAQEGYEEAKVSLTSAIGMSPDRLDGYGLLASLLYGKLKSPAEASACIDRMVSNNQQNYRAYLGRGEWKLQLLGLAKPSAGAGGEGGSRESMTRSQQLQAIASDAGRAMELAPESAETLFFGTRVALARQAYEDARKYARRGLEVHPNEPRFYLALAEVETATSNSTAALENLQRGVQAATQNRELQWQLANRLIDAGNEANEAEAGTLIEKLRSVGYPSEQIGYLEARMLMRHSQWLEAIRRLEAIRPKLLARPDLVKQVDVMLGLAHRESDGGEQQLACFRRAIDLDPQWIPARLGLAESLLAANLVQQASEEYRRVLSLPGAPTAAGIEFAKTLYLVNVRQTAKEQDWREFDELLKLIERQSPQSTQIPILRAEKLVAQGRSDEASQLIATAREKNTGTLDLWIVQITLAEQARNWEQFDQLLQAADQQFGENVNLRIVRGRSLIQRYGTEARDRLKTLSQPAPTWSVQDKLVFTRNFAQIFLAIGDYDEAERLGLMGAELKPGDLSIRMLLFDVALRAKRPKMMDRVLRDVRGIAGEGPLWNYGQAVNLILLGHLAHDRQSLANARLHLTKAKSLRPTWSAIPLVSAEIEIQQGDIYTATEHLQEAISLGERNPAVLSQMVSLLFSQKRFIEADKVIHLLQERQSLLTSDVIRSASEISLRLNQPTRALELAEQLVRNSDSSTDKVWLSQVLGSLGKSQEAEQQLRKVIEADRSAPEPWIVLVQVLARANQRAKAEQIVAEAERAMAADQAPLAIAQCYELLGKIDLAQSRYQSALERAPRNVVVVRRVVEFQMRNGLNTEAESLLRNTLNGSKEIAEPDLRWATRNLALVLTTSGNPKKLDEALTLIDRNLTTGPASPVDERVKALVLASHSSSTKRRQAISILEKLLVHDSETAVEDRFLLARLYVAVGDQSKGRAEFRKILASRGDDIRFVSAYLQTILQSGETTEIDRWLTRLQALAPNDQLTAEFQAQLLFAKGLFPEVVTVVKGVVNRPQPEQDNPESSLKRQLWGARQFEQFARKLLGSKNADASAKFTAEAESLYQRYVQLRPGESLVLAEFYAHVNQLDRTLGLLKQHWNESAPERIAAVSAAVIQNLQSTPQQLVQLQEFLQTINKSLGSNPTVSLVLADLMSCRGEYQSAILLYRDVLKNGRQDIAAMNNAAVLLAMSGGDGPEAFRLIQMALDSGGPKDILIDSRGLIHLATGNPVRALADFQASLQESEGADRYFHVALAYAQLKQSESARRSLRRAQELGLSEQMLHPVERPTLAKLQASLGQ